MIRRRTFNPDGFSTVEIIVAMSVMMISMIGITTFFFGILDSEHSTRARIENQEQVRFTMLQISRDIRSSNPIALYSSVGTYETQLDVAIGDSGAQTYVRWVLNGTTLKRETLSSLNGTVVTTKDYLTNVVNSAQDITLFKYFSSNGLELTTSGPTPSTPGDIQNCTIRVQISIAADPAPGPVFSEQSDAELRNRLPGGAGC